MRMTLRKALERMEWTPDELAARASVSRATVYRLQAGEVTNPSNDTVLKLEQALKLRRGTLVFGDQVMTEQAS